MCRVRIYGKTFRSSQHAYQYAKLRSMDKYDLTNQVLNAKTPKQAKFIAQRIPEIELSSNGWHSQKYNVMEEILYAKVNSCSQFKRALLDGLYGSSSY